jgi:hypothetical protein
VAGPHPLFEAFTFCGLDLDPLEKVPAGPPPPGPLRLPADPPPAAFALPAWSTFSQGRTQTLAPFSRCSSSSVAGLRSSSGSSSSSSSRRRRRRSSSSSSSSSCSSVVYTRVILVLPPDYNITPMLRKYQDFTPVSWGPQPPILGRTLGIGNMRLESCGLMWSGFLAITRMSQFWYLLAHQCQLGTVVPDVGTFFDEIGI